MPTQMERQNTISQNGRIGIRKNCGSLRRSGMVKMAGTKRIRCHRTTDANSEPTGVALTRPNTLPVSYGATDSACLADAAGTGATGSEWTLCTERPVPPEEFTRPQMQRIFRTAYRITRNREDAEDAMQDACLQAIAHFPDFDGRSKFSTWLTRIAINSSLMILRKHRNAKTSSLNDSGDLEASMEIPEVRNPAPDAEERYLQKERATALHNEIEALRPSLKGVIELAQLSECSLRETADSLGLSIGAVKTRLFHARRILRNSRRLRPFRNDQPANRRDTYKRS